MKTVACINIHTHRPTGRPDLLEIVNVRFGEQLKDTPACFSVGLHPWYLQENKLEEATEWLRGQSTNPSVLAIGEAGLDKVTDTPWDLQMTAFRHCIEVSEAVKKPLIIHCVRAFSEIIALKKQLKPAQPWIFHGFDKNQPTADLLLREGCYLSFGRAVFREKSHAASVLQQAPGGRFLLETDAAADTGIEEMYRAAAALRGVTPENLSASLHDTFQKVFKDL